MIGDFARGAFRRWAPRPLKEARKRWHDPKARPLPIGDSGAFNLAMIHAMRSGSTVLAEMLGRHPAIHWDYEIYHQSRCAYPAGGLGPAALLARRRRYWHAPIFGFEAVEAHLARMAVAPAEAVAFIDATAPSRYVVLRRRNHLKRHVSEMLLRRHRVERRRIDEPPQRHRIRLGVADDPAALADRFARLDAFFDALMAALDGATALCLWYEDDVERDPGAGYARICDFAGIAPVPVSVTLARVNPFPLREIVEDFDDVRAALAGTPHAWMTEDA